jgi:C4-dicarboxylate transporter DctQ subunit
MRLYDRLLDIFGILTGVIAAFLAIGITFSVIGRLLRIGDIDWMIEASEYSLFCMTFLGAPWALREGVHIRVDIATNLLSERWQRRIEILADLLGLVVVGVLLIWGAKVVIASHAAHSMFSKLLIFPEWVLLILIPISAALMVVELCRRVYRTAAGRGVKAGKAEVY